MLILYERRIHTYPSTPDSARSTHKTVFEIINYCTTLNHFHIINPLTFQSF